MVLKFGVLCNVKCSDCVMNIIALRHDTFRLWLVCFIFCVLACSKILAMCFGCEQLQQIRVLNLKCQKLMLSFWLLIQERNHPVLQIQWIWLYTWRKTTVTFRHQLPLSMLCKTALVSVLVFYILWVSTVTYATAPLLMKVKGTVFVVSSEVLCNVISVLRMIILWSYRLWNHVVWYVGTIKEQLLLLYSSEMLYSSARLDIITCQKITVSHNVMATHCNKTSLLLEYQNI